MLNFALLIIAGAATWSASEYGLHRWVGHRKRSQQRFAKEHRTHHAKAGYFTAFPTKVYLASRVVIPLWLLFALLLGVPASTSYFFGFTAAYTGYELFHYSLHARAPSTAFGHWLRKHHFAHHYHHPQFNHGVTSPIWDWVFGTLKTVPVIHVPNKFVQESMPWLIDAETGEVKDAYQSDYVIRRRK